MFCPWCGAENPDGSKFCQSCGRSMELETAPAGRPARKMAPAILVAGAAAILVCCVVAVIASAAGYFLWGRGGPERIAFLDEDGNIVTILPDGSDPQTLTRDGDRARYEGLQWSPDHRWLAALRNEYSEGEWEGELWIASADGEEQLSISLDDGWCCVLPLAWAPDSRRIAVLADDFLYVIDVRAGNVEEEIEIEDLLDDGDLAQSFGGEVFCGPTWAPDGRRLALAFFEDYDVEASIYTASIYTFLPDGSDLQRLETEHEGDVAAVPLFAPRGNRLAFVVVADPGDETAEPQLHVARADGSRPERIDRDGLPLEWSADGAILLYREREEYGGNFYIYSFRSDQRTRIRLEDPIRWCTLSPDGRQVACQVSGRDEEIILLNLETDEEEALEDGRLPAW